MTIRCPACGKSSDAAEQCPRCGCELTALREVSVAAAWHRTQACVNLAEHHMEAALRHAAISWDLRHTLEAARIAVAAAVASRSPDAPLWLRRFRSHS
ncbi:MAG TPA: hypothetical protein VIT91_02765 [Chthoniobacterales bacterium]